MGMKAVRECVDMYRCTTPPTTKDPRTHTPIHPNRTDSLHLTALHATNPGAAPTPELWARCLLRPAEVERLLHSFLHLLFLLVRAEAEAGG